MPTCSNQSGYDAASSNATIKQMQYMQQATHNKNLALQGHPVPGANSAGWTLFMCQEFVWWMYNYFLGRAPSQTEQGAWATPLHNQQIAAEAVRTQIGSSAECYARFGCS